MRKKKDTSILVYRDKDLLRVYLEIIREMGMEASQVTRWSIIERVLKSPASCFHVSVCHAGVNVSLLLRGKEICCLPNKREMFEEIKRRYLEQRPDGVIGRDFSQIITTIVEAPAPKFYLEPGTVFNRLNRLMKRL